MRIVEPQEVRYHWLVRSLLIVFGLSVFGLVNPPNTLHAEEPIARFLGRLKEERHFGLAVVYLEQLEKAELLTPELQADLPIEKLLLLQESITTVRTMDELAKRQKEVESGWKKWLDENPEHPRRSEARLELADILLSRGQSSLDRSRSREGTEADRQSAVDAFTAARELFDSTITQLRPILEQMQGARISADDAKAVALRDKLQGEYRQAEILRGLAAKFLGECFAPSHPDFKRWLEIAETELSEVVKKTPGAREAGRHTLSLLYRGQVQALLGKVDEANDSFVRVADIEEGGVFREWRVQATAALIRLLANPEQNKYEAVMGRAEQVMKSMQNQERFQPEWINLQMAISEAQISWSKQLEAQPNTQVRARTIRNDARTTLQALARKPGQHESKAKELLASLGIEAAPKSEEAIPALKNLKQALGLANERLDQAKDDELAIAILRQQMADADPANREELAKQIETMEQGTKGKVSSAHAILRSGVNLFTKEDSRDDLNRARYLLALTSLRLDRYWDGLATAEFMARNCTSNDIAMESGRLAMFAYRKILSNDAEGRFDSLAQPLESLAQFMIEKWPNGEPTQEAIMVLVQESWKNKQWDEAVRFTSLLPSGGAASAIRRDLGVAFWGLHQEAVRDLRKQGLPESPEATQYKVRSEELSKSGFDDLTSETLDQRAVECGNCLATIYLKSNRVAEAKAILEKADVGPLAVAKNGKVELEPRVKLESLRLQLQSIVFLWIQDTQAKLDSNTIQGIVQEMQTIAKASTDGDKLLSDSLLILAKDLSDQVDQVKTPADRSKLADGIQLLMTQLVTVSSDISVLDWAGTTMLELAKRLEKQSADAAAIKSLGAAAEKAYERILAVEAQTPGSIVAAKKKPEEIALKQGICKSQAGDYQAAVALFSQFLAQNKNVNNLSAQLEAAYTLHRWAKSANTAEAWKRAMLGEGKQKNGEALIWGWGLMSKKIANQNQVLETFFESRLRLAEARFQLGAVETDPAKRSKIVDQALSDLRTTAINFPSIKTSSWFKETDDLARRIQRDLQKDQTGLASFWSNQTVAP